MAGGIKQRMCLKNVRKKNIYTKDQNETTEIPRTRCGRKSWITYPPQEKSKIREVKAMSHLPHERE